MFTRRVIRRILDRLLAPVCSRGSENPLTNAPLEFSKSRQALKAETEFLGSNEIGILAGIRVQYGISRNRTSSF